MDIVDPDVSPGAVREGALNLHLRQGTGDRGTGRSRQEEDGKKIGVGTREGDEKLIRSLGVELRPLFLALFCSFTFS